MNVIYQNIYDKINCHFIPKHPWLKCAQQYNGYSPQSVTQMSFNFDALSSWSQFHKGWAHGANDRDSSIHLPWFALYAYAQLLRYKKLLKSCALRFAPCSQLYEIDPGSQFRNFAPYADLSHPTPNFWEALCSIKGAEQPVLAPLAVNSSRISLIYAVQPNFTKSTPECPLFRFPLFQTSLPIF